MSYRTIIVAALAGVLALGLTACGEGDVAARVNGETISQSEIDEEIERMKTEYPELFSGADAEGRELDYREQLLQSRIDQLLVTQAAEERGIDVSESDVDEYIDEIRSSFPDEEDFQAQLEASGVTEEDLRRQAHDQLLVEQLVDEVSGDIEITDEDIQEYYEENISQFEKEAAKRPAHILISEEETETAEQVLEEIRDGADFAAMAEQYSIDDASAQQGGDLGWPSYSFVPEFEEALQDLEVGEVSDMVKSQFGWHIITVLDEREDYTQPLSEVSDQIETTLRQQQQSEVFGEFLNGLRESAEIEIP